MLTWNMNICTNIAIIVGNCFVIINVIWNYVCYVSPWLHHAQYVYISACVHAIQLYADNVLIMCSSLKYIMHLLFK